MDTETIIKNLTNDIKDSCRYAFQEQWKNDKDHRQILQNRLNILLEKYISDNKLENELHIKMEGEGSIIYPKFYYKERELYLENMEQLTNFNPYDYMYIDENGVIRSCETSPVTITLNLNEEKESDSKMNLDLDKEDLISLVKGISPYYSVMDNPLIKKHGSYIGGFKDEWKWKYGTFENCSEEEIWEIYKLCKDSWK